MNTPSNSNTIKKAALRWIDILLLVLAVTAILIAVSKENDSNIYAVLDESEVIEERIDAGDSPLHALVYFNTLMKVYEHNSVIVFDKDALVTYPNTMDVKLPTKEGLFTVAKEAGFPVTKETYESAASELEKQQQAIRKALNIL